jgi:excinuclease ABC subunit A
MLESSPIRVRGARQNNLAGFDIDLPRNRLIVVTGPSGSGKSSFAFDTVYAEGQRRYVETFSPYTRQFLERMDKPLVDSIEGIPPSIALEQTNHIKSTRSTVGTLTEINDYLKLFIPRVAKAYCPECKREVVPESPQSIHREALETLSGKTLLVTFPVPVGKNPKPADFFSFLKEQGYLRVLLFGKVVRTDCGNPPNSLPAVVDVIADRITVSPENSTRLFEAVEAALRLGQGRLALVEISEGSPPVVHPHSTGWHCAHCDLKLRAPVPGLFSFNHPLGACPECKGFGRTIGIDYRRVIPDPSLSIAEGVVRPFQTGFSRECQEDLLRHCWERGIDIHMPFEELPEKDREFVLNGDEGGTAAEKWEQGRWYGVRGYFEWLESKAYKMHVRVLLSRYRAYRECDACKGGRYQPETLNFRIQGADGTSLTLPEINALPVRRLEAFIESIEVPESDSGARLLQSQILSRVRYLNAVGLGYLSLDRPARSLSGGEIQRVNLTSCLGASLVNTLFVMDEPSVGLHPRDTGRLVQIMHRLRDKGNTLLVVEHEEAVIRAADHVVDIGPGRGVTGGRLVFSGPASKLTDAVDSLTGKYLSGELRIPVPEKRRKPRGKIRIRGIRHNNLQKLDVDIPLGVFCCVTGVSGSGKSSLVHDVLYRNLDQTAASDTDAPGFCRELDAPLDISDVVMVDQSPLASTPRSTPAVYLGVFDRIRDLFGSLPDAVAAGFSPISFSFNSPRAARCERCAGLGFEKVEMQFLSDLFLRCPECEGKRYTKRLLGIHLRGKSIHDVLEMSAAEAVAFFSDIPGAEGILPPLRLLDELGMGYLRLGQPVNTLSGGESQRLKLLRRLVDKKPGEKSLIILDEPTTGLHFDDIRLLLSLLQRLVNEGNSLVVVEHNLELIKCADYIIDLGPEAGDEGGRIVAKGTPEDVAKCMESHTGRYLRITLGLEEKLPLKEAPPAFAPHAKDSANQCIRVRGAREHNLKNISLDIPREKMVVVTGLSGSGKSTLAFDLLFAEGQHRFLDSMSPYARQFVEQMEKPDVDFVDGLPPTVAIEQRVTRGGGKSTVATVTEIYHFLRLLYAKLGTQFCPECDLPVEKSTLEASVEKILPLLQSGPLRVFAPLVRGRKGFHTEVARWAERHGFQSLLIDGKLVAVKHFQKLERFKEHTIDVLVGEVVPESPDTLESLLRRAAEIGSGTARVLDGKNHFHIVSLELNCPGCGAAFEELDPRLFSFNSPHGWCPHCKGFGEVWHAPSMKEFESVAEAELEEEKHFESLAEGESHICPLCEGARLNRIARHVRLEGRTLPEICKMSSAAALEWIQTLQFTGSRAEIAKDPLLEITRRLRFLNEVGLEYLALGRSAKTLSGGESQRIRLAAQLGSNLCGVLYVLDEPTIGLHPADNERLLGSLQALVQKGNSMIVVEHDEETMRRADYIIDLGPGAGRLGGEVIANGSLEEVLKNPVSLTARHLTVRKRHPIRGKRRSLKNVEWIEVRGASKNNLVNVDARFPVGRLSVIGGVSGSGKSSLVRGVLLPALRSAQKKRGTCCPNPPCWKSIKGAEFIGSIVEIDQSPIGKTSRSTPGTYIKVHDEIRKLFASLPESRLRGYGPSRFSFNNEGGRCESCQGQGVIRLEMSFLPPTFMPCEECQGRRFNAPTLEVLYQGKSIGDVMQMTIAEAASFFSNVPKIARSLNLLEETGLGYLQLGQPSPTLSGGEAQRVKLVAELAARAGMKESLIRTGRASRAPLYVLEEPTIGLHAADVERLISVLHRLVDEGATVLVIEHNLDLIAEADYFLEIGPGPGEKGGRIVAAGTPEVVARSKASVTAPFLLPLLQNKKGFAANGIAQSGV